MIANDFKKYCGLFSEYTELRFQENRNLRIVFVNGNLSGNEVGGRSGVSARVCKNGSWGFASTPEQTAAGAKSVVKSALENAVFLSTRDNLNRSIFPKQKAAVDKDFSTHHKRKTQKELIEFVKEIDAHIKETHKNIISRTVLLSSLEMEKSLITSDGSEAFSLTPRTVLIASLSMQSSSGPVELLDMFGGLGNFEDHFKKPSDLYARIAALVDDLAKKTDGISAVAGSCECILDPELAGILAHEAIGHTTEADFVMGGSIAANYLGKTIADPLVSLVDFAHTAFNRTCPVPVYVDDEGTLAQDVPIIEKGVLRNYMHNKRSALHFDTVPLGNARAYQFYDEPLIRMRNTAFLPGNSKLEEMIASVKNGYYLVKTSNGQADSTSEFMFGVTQGYEIKNGKIGKAIKDTTISGVAFDVLKTVTMVSDDMKWHVGGMCGKKQPITVGMGGPAIKCRLNIGGK